MARRFYFKQTGSEFGPVDYATLENYVRTGGLTADDKFRVGNGEWIAVSEIARYACLSIPASWMILTPTGIFGPILDIELIRLAKAGDIVPTSRVRTADSRNWLNADDLGWLDFSSDSRIDPKEKSQNQLGHNQEMQKLILECVQRKHPPAAKSKRNRIRITLPGIPISAMLSWIVQFLSLFLSQVVNPLIDAGAWLIQGLMKSQLIRWGIVAFFACGLLLHLNSFRLNKQAILADLEQAFSDLEYKRADEVDDATWEEFQIATSEKLARLVPRLEAAANVNDPIALSLLSISRDYLPQLLEKRSSEELEQKIQFHFDRISTILGGGSDITIVRESPRRRQPQSIDLETRLIFGVDVVLLIGAATYFGHKWYRRTAV